MNDKPLAPSGGMKICESAVNMGGGGQALLAGYTHPSAMIIMPTVTNLTV